MWNDRVWYHFAEDAFYLANKVGLILYKITCENIFPGTKSNLCSCCIRIWTRFPCTVEWLYLDKCTKHQFIHLLTATCNEWHIENSKIIKRWYHLPLHRLTVNVLLNNITFLWFLLFSMCHSLHVAINKCINWCFVHLYLLFYYYNKVFMLMVNQKPSAFHGHEDIQSWIFWGQNFNF